MCALNSTAAVLAISLPSTKHGLSAWIEIIRMSLNGVLVQSQTIFLTRLQISEEVE